MNLDNYQQLAGRTLIDEPGFTLSNAEIMLSWNAHGLAGEAGEVAEHIKKAIYHRHGLDPNYLKKELGDVLWYVAAIASNLGMSLSEVAEANIEKLKARYPEGYSSEASMNRAGEA